MRARMHAGTMIPAASGSAGSECSVSGLRGAGGLRWVVDAACVPVKRTGIPVRVERSGGQHPEVVTTLGGWVLVIRDASASLGRGCFTCLSAMAAAEYGHRVGTLSASELRMLAMKCL